MLLRHSVMLLLIFNLFINRTNAYQLWDWRERQRRRIERQSRRHLFKSEVDNVSDETNNEIPDTLPTLNVSSKDSPYALIDEFFPDRENNHKQMENQFENQFGNYKGHNLGDLAPKEVWLSEGDLLVLKGGATKNRKAFDNPWTPLDDFVAPYREPKLPPPDFIPSDTGVGVALPPEDTEVGVALPPIEEATESAVVTAPNPPTTATKHPFLKGFFFDEEKIINEMENFHSERRAEIFNSMSRPPQMFKKSHFFVTTLPPIVRSAVAELRSLPVKPMAAWTTPTPIWDSPTTTMDTPTTMAPPTPAGAGGYFVSTVTPNSFFYAYQTERGVAYNPSYAGALSNKATPPIATTIPPPTATTPTTTTPAPVRQLKSRGRGPKNYPIKPRLPYLATPLNAVYYSNGHHQQQNFGQKLTNEVDIDNKVAEERQDHFYMKRVWPPPPKEVAAVATPSFATPPFRSRRRILPAALQPISSPTLASNAISSLKPRTRSSYYNNNKNRKMKNGKMEKWKNAGVVTRPALSSTALRRSSNPASDHRYVSFFRSQIGGNSWGYSYRLK
jgi:hypothetical protein